MEEQLVKISVRNLVEFIMRAGDIDNRKSGRAEREAMQKGSRIHRKIQGRKPSDYRAEVPLKMEIKRERFCLLLEGRADGIGHRADVEYIDEIKGVYKELQFIHEPVETHLAQAKCYAYLYSNQNQLNEIGVQMTYCNIETEQIKYFFYSYQYEELRQWFEELIKEYEKWAVFQADWLAVRNRSIASLHFPFAYREGQKQLVSGVFRTIEQKKRLFIQASTGVGKTISTIYPAIQAIGAGLSGQIFYLTAKTITRTAAEETFKLLKEQGLMMKTLTITAKEKLCACTEVDCNPLHCERAKGHFDRVNDCVYELLQRECELSREVIERYAGRYRVCPYEMCLDAALWCDAVICDYNYVFDYNICLKRFFGDSVRGSYLFLIDEAHNLLERGREMYSASLSKEMFLQLRKQCLYTGPFEHALKKAFENCNRVLLAWKKQCSDYLVVPQTALGNFILALDGLMGQLENYLEADVGNSSLEELQCRELMLDFYFRARDFLNIYSIQERLDWPAEIENNAEKNFSNGNYVNYFEYIDNQFYIHQYCVNPAQNLEHFLEKSRSSIFFSATMLPIDYYMKLLSANSDDYSLYAESSFSSDKRLIVIGTDVSARYTRRNETEYEKIADYLNQIIMQKTGNYIVYFPSYRFMEAVYCAFQNKYPEIDCSVQEAIMSEQEKEAFLNCFEEKQENGNKDSFLAFCVLGGSFSEGIDLKGDLLIGVIIVGTGLPQICRRRELLREYFEQAKGQGFSYAYRYPGFSKALQAAGRVIRTEKDKGVIVLLDSRFMEPDYQILYPREWAGIRYCRLDSIAGILKEFWED